MSELEIAVETFDGGAMPYPLAVRLVGEGTVERKGVTLTESPSAVFRALRSDRYTVAVDILDPQCTTYASMRLGGVEAKAGRVRIALPGSAPIDGFVRRGAEAVPGVRVFYRPTGTTAWSSTGKVSGMDGSFQLAVPTGQVCDLCVFADSGVELTVVRHVEAGTRGVIAEVRRQ